MGTNQKVNKMMTNLKELPYKEAKDTVKDVIQKTLSARGGIEPKDTPDAMWDLYLSLGDDVSFSAWWEYMTYEDFRKLEEKYILPMLKEIEALMAK
jgi:hypothetical protein